MRNSGTFLGIIVMVGVFITATDTHWQISVPNSRVRMSSVVEFHQGLWKHCKSEPGFATQCDPYGGTLPLSLRAQRIMMIFSCFIGTAGLFTIASSTQTCWISAVSYTLLGLLVLTSVTTSAYNILYRHRFEPGMPQRPYQRVHYGLGIDIYIGWISGGLALVTGNTSSSRFDVQLVGQIDNHEVHGMNRV